jgi:hypothetical protein
LADAFDERVQLLLKVNIESPPLFGDRGPFVEHASMNNPIGSRVGSRHDGLFSLFRPLIRRPGGAVELRGTG